MAFFRAYIPSDEDLLPEARKAIREASTPREAKRLGRSSPLRQDWEEVKVAYMESILRKKFSDEVMKLRLLSTGDEELVEGNHWNDTFWGVCRGEGENHLGKLLMKIRKELRDEQAKKA